MSERAKTRCPWSEKPDIYVAYHDQEWGVPVWDERRMFEFLILETFQAGLSWLTILRKRDAFRQAFDDFDVERVAAYSDEKLAELANCAGIVRNRAKIAAAVGNARAFLEIAAEHGSFCKWIWSFTGGEPIVHQWTTQAEVPAVIPLAADLSRELKQRGFRFVGPTVVYAHMQATGMVNDHLVSCFRHSEVKRLKRS